MGLSGFDWLGAGQDPSVLCRAIYLAFHASSVKTAILLMHEGGVSEIEGRRIRNF